MHVENKVDPERTHEEFDNLKNIYKKIGLDVWIMDPEPGLPDMVYTANCGFVIDNLFIKANFRYQQRRKESDFAEKLFRQKKFKIATLPSNVYFEGQGDLFFRDGKFFAAYGRRTSKKAIGHLENILGEKIITFMVKKDPYFFHLDTCFAPLGKGKVIIHPASFSNDDIDKIKKNFRKVITVSKKDNPFFCCNIVATDDAVIVGKGMSKDIKRTLEKEGLKVFETPMNEYFKGGGSVKCTTLEFFRSNS